MTVLFLRASPAEAGAQSWNGHCARAVRAFAGHSYWAPAFAGEAQKFAGEATMAGVHGA